jgi:hypothetical protein
VVAGVGGPGGVVDVGVNEGYEGEEEETVEGGGEEEVESLLPIC